MLRRDSRIWPHAGFLWVSDPPIGGNIGPMRHTHFGGGAPCTTKPGPEWTEHSALMPEPDSRDLQPVGNAAEQEPTVEEAEQTSKGTTTPYARVETVPPGGVGLARVERGRSQLHIDHMTHRAGFPWDPGRWPCGDCLRGCILKFRVRSCLGSGG